MPLRLFAGWSDLSLSAATRDLKMSTRWSKGTHCGASSRSAASDTGRPATAGVSLQVTVIYLGKYWHLLVFKAVLRHTSTRQDILNTFTMT